MKKLLLYTLVFLLLTLIASAQVDTIAPFPLSLAERFTTNLVFPYPVINVDLGSGDVLAKKLGRTGNVVLLKANRAHFAATNVSVYLANGMLYSFLAGYADSPVVCNYLFRKEANVNVEVLERDAVAVAKAPGFLQVGGSDAKVRLQLKGVYLKDGLLWLGFAASNTSLIGFDPDLMRFSLDDKKHARRTAVQSISLEPAYASGMEPLPGGSRASLGVGFPPFTIAKGKRLVIEWSERNGRRVIVRVKAKALLRARKLD